MEPFDWQRLFIGEEHPWYYVFEIVYRSAMMYLVLMIFFKITGKTGIRQLSTFDLILIVGLGTAAGDPMIMDDIPLLHAVAVFATILSVYLILNKLSQRSHRIDVLLEGETACVLMDGKVLYDKLMKEGLTLMQFFSELRQQQVTHLGQVRRAYIEISGETSVIFLEDDAIKPGLPILPEMLEEKSEGITGLGFHSCVQCGNTLHFQNGQHAPACEDCGCGKWVKSISERRVS